MINALGGHLAEHGLFAARGPAHLKRLADAIADDSSMRPDEMRSLRQMYQEHIDTVTARIAELDATMKRAAGVTNMARRAQTMPGVYPDTALTQEVFAPDLTRFRRERDFAAWLGLVPRQRSTGGKARLGKTSKMG